MIDIKNFVKLSLYLPISFVLNLLIILVFIERRNNSAFDSFFFYYCLITTCYFLARAFIFVTLYLKQRKEKHLATIEDDQWPSLTVIVPAYNEEDVIQLTLKSLLKVDYPEMKIIVVDDGSNDKTGELVKEIVSNNNILYLRQENQGKAQALNNGINHVDTEYTMMVDADCIFPSDSFKKAIQYITYYGDDAIGGVLSVANPQLTIAQMQVMEYGVDRWLFKIFQNHFQCIKSDRTQDVIPGALGLFLTKSLKSVGPLSNNFLAEDVDLTAQLVERYYRLSFCPYLITYTVVPETLESLNKQRKR